MFMPALFDTNNMLSDFNRALRSYSDFLWDEDIDKKLYGKNARNIMKTDVKDSGDHYDVAIDLPGFKKDEISVSVDNGYLTVSAEKGQEKEEKEEKSGRYIRRERCAGSVSRSYYVGSSVKPEDVKAKFEDGILALQVAKKEEKEEEKKALIKIE